MEGGRGDQAAVGPIELPSTFAAAPGGLSGDMSANVLREYAALAQDIRDGTHIVPDFAYALRKHQLLAAVEEAARSGITQTVG